MWSEPEKSDERIVVSEMGEQWSPKMEPASTDEIVVTREKFCNSVGMLTVCECTNGITKGMTKLIVAHELPVAKLTPAEITLVKKGSQRGSRCGPRKWTI